MLSWFVGHRTDALVSAARVVGVLAGFVSLFIASLLLGFWLWRRSRLVIAGAPTVALSIGGLASTIAKEVFDRPRPSVTFHETTVTLAAFPSGHATDAAAFSLAAALTVGLVVTRRRRAQLLLVVLAETSAACVGVSRLILGVHWLSDVVAGWALGTAAAVAVVSLVWYLTTRTTRAPQPEPAVDQRSPT